MPEFISLLDLSCPRKCADIALHGNYDERKPIYAASHCAAVKQVLCDLLQSRCGSDLNLAHLDAQTRDAVWGTEYPPYTDRESAVVRVRRSVEAFIAADDQEAVAGTLDLQREGQFDVIDKKTGESLFGWRARLDRTLIRASEPSRLIVRDSNTTPQCINLKEAFVMLWVARKMYPDYSSHAIEYHFLDEDFRVVRNTVEEADVQGQRPIVLGLALRAYYGDGFPAIRGEQCADCRLRASCAELTPEEVDAEANMF